MNVHFGTCKTMILITVNSNCVLKQQSQYVSLGKVKVRQHFGYIWWHLLAGWWWSLSTNQLHSSAHASPVFSNKLLRSVCRKFFNYL